MERLSEAVQANLELVNLKLPPATESMHIVASQNWREGWHYLCLADALDEDGCHATLDLPGLSLTAQNFGGNRVAFWNVCSHRSVQMRPAGIGKGALRCPYHGWTYNAAGVPAGIPDNELFYGIERAGRVALALRQAKLEACGALLFVSADLKATNLREHLDGDFDRLAGLELRNSWTVAERRSRIETSPTGLPGVVIDRTEGWFLIRTRQPIGDASWDITAQLLHPQRPLLDAAPATLQAAMVAE